MENHIKTSISEYKLKYIKKLIEELPTKGYETFTTTTIFNIFYCSLGIYGSECKKLGIDLLESFVYWMKHYRKSSYKVAGDFTTMYHPLLIEYIIEWCNTLPDEVNEEEILKEFAIKFQEKYDELQQKGIINDTYTNYNLFLIISSIGIILSGIYYYMQ
jgi:hypothetical protein